MIAKPGDHWHENLHPEISPSLELLFVAHVIVLEPIDFGQLATGHRLVSTIEPGGRVDGPRIYGKILPGSTSVQLVRHDKVVEHEANLLLGLDDGQNIFCHSSHILVMSAEAKQGLIEGDSYDPGLIYSRGSVRFEAAEDGPYDWLNHNVFVGKSIRTARGSTWSVWQVL
jgi:hypothetical protein